MIGFLQLCAHMSEVAHVENRKYSHWSGPSHYNRTVWPTPDLNISCHKCFRQMEGDGGTAASFHWRGWVCVCGEGGGGVHTRASKTLKIEFWVTSAGEGDS